MSAPKDNNDHEENEEETPSMRSIMIGSAPVAIRPFPLAQLPKMPRSLAKAAPVKMKSSVVRVWKPDSIPRVPEYYQLGRSRVTISDCEGDEITSRIGECLQQQPLSITFQKNEAVCETACHARFIVKIFEDDNDKFVVEVQRRSGCSLVCQKFCRGILRAAKGNKGVLVKSRTFAIPPSIHRQHGEREKIVNEDVQNSINLMKQEKIDVQMLGVSALVSLTEKNKVEVCDFTLEFVLRHIASPPVKADDRSLVCQFCLECLNILANLLRRNSLKCSDITDNDFIQILANGLQYNDLFVAQHSARCLKGICRCFPQLKAGITNKKIFTILENVLERHEKHKLIENEIQQLKLEFES